MDPSDSPYVPNFDLVPPSPRGSTHDEYSFYQQLGGHDPSNPLDTSSSTQFLDNSLHLDPNESLTQQRPHTPSYTGSGSYYGSPYSSHSDIDFHGDELNFEMLSGFDDGGFDSAQQQQQSTYSAASPDYDDRGTAGSGSLLMGGIDLGMEMLSSPPFTSPDFGQQSSSYRASGYDHGTPSESGDAANVQSQSASNTPQTANFSTSSHHSRSRASSVSSHLEDNFTRSQKQQQYQSQLQQQQSQQYHQHSSLSPSPSPHLSSTFPQHQHQSLSPSPQIPGQSFSAQQQQHQGNSPRIDMAQAQFSNISIHTPNWGTNPLPPSSSPNPPQRPSPLPSVHNTPMHRGQDLLSGQGMGIPTINTPDQDEGGESGGNLGLGLHLDVNNLSGNGNGAFGIPSSSSDFGSHHSNNGDNTSNVGDTNAGMLGASAGNNTHLGAGVNRQAAGSGSPQFHIVPATPVNGGGEGTSVSPFSMPSQRLGTVVQGTELSVDNQLSGTHSSPQGSPLLQGDFSRQNQHMRQQPSGSRGVSPYGGSQRGVSPYLSGQQAGFASGDRSDPNLGQNGGFNAAGSANLFDQSLQQGQSSMHSPPLGPPSMQTVQQAAQAALLNQQQLNQARAQAQAQAQAQVQQQQAAAEEAERNQNRLSGTPGQWTSQGGYSGYAAQQARVAAQQQQQQAVEVQQRQQQQLANFQFGASSQNSLAAPPRGGAPGGHRVTRSDVVVGMLPSGAQGGFATGGSGNTLGMAGYQQPPAHAHSMSLSVSNSSTNPSNGYLSPHHVPSLSTSSVSSSGSLQPPGGRGHYRRASAGSASRAERGAELWTSNSGHLMLPNQRRVSPYPSPNASPRVRYNELDGGDDGLDMSMSNMGMGGGMGGMGMGMPGHLGGGLNLGLPGNGPLGSLGPEIGEPPVSAGYGEEVAIAGRRAYSRSRHDDGASSNGGGDDTSVGNGSAIEGVAKPTVTTGRTANASIARRKQEANFACTIPGCNSTFTRGFNLKGHLRSHFEQKPYKCHWPGCGKGFARQHDCKRHEQLHSNFRPFECDGCKKQFARMDALNRHLRSEAGAECAKVVEAARAAGTASGYTTSDQDLNAGQQLMDSDSGDAAAWDAIEDVQMGGGVLDESGAGGPGRGAAARRGGRSGARGGGRAGTRSSKIEDDGDFGLPPPPPLHLQSRPPPRRRGTGSSGMMADDEPYVQL